MAVSKPRYETYADLIIEEFIRRPLQSMIKEEFRPELEQHFLSRFALWRRLNGAIVEIEVTAGLENPKTRAETKRLLEEFQKWCETEDEAEKAEQEAKTAKQEAETAQKMAKYLKETGFHCLGDALAFFKGNAAPPRVKGQIELPPKEIDHD
jgi:hypothetical protein